MLQVMFNWGTHTHAHTADSAVSFGSQVVVMVTASGDQCKSQSGSIESSFVLLN